MAMIDSATDIEIYVLNVSREEITDWLENSTDGMEILPKQKGMPKNAVRFAVTWNSNITTGLIMERVTEGYTSIWFDGVELPWVNDLQCATAASQAFNKSVRITAGGWQENAGEDDWLEVSADGTGQPIVWKTV